MRCERDALGTRNSRQAGGRDSLDLALDEISTEVIQSDPSSPRLRRHDFDPNARSTNRGKEYFLSSRLGMNCIEKDDSRCIAEVVSR